MQEIARRFGSTNPDAGNSDNDAGNSDNDGWSDTDTEDTDARMAHLRTSRLLHGF